MRQKQASRSLAETATKGRATLVAYKNRSLQSVNEESWPHERSECFGSFEPVFNDISLSVIVLTRPDGADLFDLKVPGNIYTRMMNPTTAVLEERTAAMEGGIADLAVASGMAAITYAIHCLCTKGDNILSTSQLYGETYNLFVHSFPNQGIETRMISHDDYEGFEKAVEELTKAIFCESIGNPAGNVVDIEKLAEIGNRHGIPVIVDNTVATPYLCRPIELGASIVIHSLTKYIGGHGGSIGGVIVDSGEFDWVANKERFPVFNESDPSYHGVIYNEALGPAAFIGRCRVVTLRNTGAAISPTNAFNILQGLETLGLRIERHCENAENSLTICKITPK